MKKHLEHMTPHQARIILASLRRNDARSLHPELGSTELWRELNEALDLLRLTLMDITDPEEKL
jgi:hypothetical protein